jgi:Ca-activated chloride channel family protein
MTHVLPLLTDEEVSQCLPADEEAGFGALHTARGHLPLAAMDVRAAVDGLLAEVAVRQTFVNAFDEPLEATYIFPLPDRAAVTGFRMEVAGRVVEGVLEERGAARRQYRQAIEAGHRAAIAEEERPGVFTLRVGNLMPGEQAVVRLTLVEPLPYDDGEATFRFPLVVAPRYIPGTPLPGAPVGDGTSPDTDAVPDASRVTPPVLLPGFPNPVRLALAVELLPSDLPVSDFRSSLHAVSDGETSRGVRQIRVQPGERLNRDFILRFRLGERAVRTALVLRPDDGGAEGTFLLTVVPPADRDAAPRPRDVVFLLDRSGSMAGWKMVAARRALARMVDTLTPRDRFAVHAFDNSITSPPEFARRGLVAASDRHRFRAVEFLAKIEARGGTEMARPLDQGVTELADGSPDRDRVLVLVTDGQVGNEDQILRHLGPRLGGIRIFTLGIDRAVNGAFLKRLAVLGGGSCELVESEDRLDEVMDRVHRRIGTPVLTGLRLEPTGLEIESGSVVPGRLPDLFAGAPLLIMGRYRGRGPAAVTLAARDEAGSPWSVTVRGRAGEHPAVAQVWARGHLRELEDRFVVAPGERAALEKRIIATSLGFGVLCRFTAYVAVDRSEVVNPAGQVHKVTQPVELPAGWEQSRDREVTRGEIFNATRPALSAPMPMAPPPAASPPPAGQFRAFKREAVRRRTSPSRKKGLVGRVLDSLFRGGKKQDEASDSPPPAPVDLTAYRGRARQLLDVLNKGSTAEAAERLRTLGVLAEKLQALVEDLKTVGAPGPVIKPLEKVVKDLRQLLAAKRPPEGRIAQLWTQAAEVLQAFAGDSGNAGDRSEGFWK